MIAQPATAQFCVQSWFAWHVQGSAVQVSVFVSRFGFGTSASPPPVPASNPAPELDPPELDDEPVVSVSSDLHADAKTNEAAARVTATRRR